VAMGEMACIHARMDAVVEPVTVIAARGAKAKEVAVAVHGVGEDLHPALWIDGELAGGVVELPGDVDAWAEFAREVVADLSPDLVCLCAEAYGTTDTNEPRRELSRAFAEGDEQVTEGLVVVGATREFGIAVHTPYRYDGRSVAWGTPNWFELTGDVGGRIVSFVIEALENGGDVNVSRAARRLDAMDLDYKILDKAAGKLRKSRR